MKKLVFALVMLLGMTLASCGKYTKDSDSANDSVNTCESMCPSSDSVENADTITPGVEDSAL